MMRILALPMYLLYFWANAAGAGLTFEGAPVTIAQGRRDTAGELKSPATVCIEVKPARRCYTAPESYGNNARAEIIQLKPDVQALLFTAETEGTSGWSVNYALLVPGNKGQLDDLLSGVKLSNQSQSAFWDSASVSDAKIFVTAEFVWGPSEGHYDNHRYLISAYVRLKSDLEDTPRFYLQDRYMTVQSYDSEMGGPGSILRSERAELLARLKRVQTVRGRATTVHPK